MREPLCFYEARAGQDMCRVSTAIPSHQNHTELLHRDQLQGLDRQGYWEIHPSLLALHQQHVDERWERGFQSALKEHHDEQDHQDESEIQEDSLLGLGVD